jgi:hypothetical protein
MATTQSLQDQCSWKLAAAEGTFYLRDRGANVECIVPLETLLDRFPASSSTDEDTFRAHERLLRSVAKTLIRQGCGRGEADWSFAASTFLAGCNDNDHHPFQGGSLNAASGPLSE